MKSTLFNSILCASLLVFAVGCGQSKSKGGGSNSGYINPINQSQTSQQNIQTLNNWYAGKTEGQRVLGVLTVEKKKQTSNNNQNCSSLDLGIINIPYCSYSYSSSNSNSGTVVETKTVNAFVDNTNTIASKPNAELASIFNGSAGQIVQAVNVGSQAVRVDVLSNNLVTSYIIDMTYHSQLNPVVKMTNSQTPETIVVTAKCAFQGTCQGI